MFTPKPEELLPPMGPELEVVLLARALWSEGYDDHLSGHITVRRPGGTLLCTPWNLLWSELRPEHVIEIDLEGERVKGDWPVPPGIPLHLAVHARRDVEVVVHGHPRWGTVWANAARIPKVFDQSAMKGGSDLVVVDEYDGPVSSPRSAAEVVRMVGDADLALLQNHGVLVLAPSVRTAFVRSVSLEHRCRMAWQVEAFGGGVEVSEAAKERYAAIHNERPDSQYEAFWAAMARQELGRLAEVGP